MSVEIGKNNKTTTSTHYTLYTQNRSTFINKHTHPHQVHKYICVYLSVSIVYVYIYIYTYTYVSLYLCSPVYTYAP